MLPEAITWLESGGLVLAANAHLAWTLGLAYDQCQAAQGRSSWPSPDIATPAAAWLANLEEAVGLDLRLTPVQELWLWEDIIAADAGAAAAPLDLSATARLAASAWERALAWRLPLDGPDWNETDETQAFQRWAQAFQRRCRPRHWVSAAELPDRLAASAARRIALLGFDELTPQLRALLDRLRAGEVEIVELAPLREAAPVSVVAADDAEAELAAAAEWARRLLDAGAEGPIGLVLPDLAARRAQVERALEAALHPGRPPGDPAPRAYRLSLGPALSQHPVTAAALLLLHALHDLARDRRLPVEQASALLQCPFLGGAEGARFPRALQDLRWRAQHRPWVDASELRLPAAPLAPRPYAAWAAHWRDALAGLGWPGERALTSPEHQAVEAWRDLLADLAGLDELAPRAVPGADALRRLRSLAQARVFQPRAARAPALHVLGWLEAAGQTFSHLWIAGLDDRAVPAPAAPHPLLPLALQRRHGLPHATTEREATVAARAWLRLRQGADTVVASFARRDGERELRASALLAPWPTAAAHAPAAPAAPDWEELDDEGAPAVPPDRRVATSRLFTEQSLCPFRALAHLRLRAAAPEPAAVGLPPATRGSLLHDALRFVGQGDSAERAADRAVEREPLLRGQPGLARLERQRLIVQIAEWQAIEARRQPFKIVACEQTRETVFAGWSLRLRLDRVDELEDGRRVLLDYKSGDTSKGMWDPARFKAPQLPLYLVTDPESARVAAIAFAQLQPGDMALKAAACEHGLFPYAWVPEDGWEVQVAAWRARLEALAREHGSGRAPVAPLDADVCQTCDLHGLCRIGEQAARALREEDRDA